MSIDTSVFLRGQQDARVRLAILPVWDPDARTAHDGDSGRGHTVRWYPVPRMGPNRVMFVGGSYGLHGELSYLRGGGSPSGHHWRIYESDSEIVGSGDLVFSAEGATSSWSPPVAGIFRAELHLDGQADDGFGPGCRFFRVLDEESDMDLPDADTVEGTFDIDRGGHVATVTYKPESAAQLVQDWSRVVVMLDTWYQGVKHTEDTGGDALNESTQLNALVVQDTIREDHQSATISFQLASPSWALSRIPIRGYPVTIDGIPSDFPLFFGDPDRSIVGMNVVDYIRQSDAEMPVHAIPGMTYTDPLLHILQRHTNYMQWWDVELFQDDAKHLFPFSFQLTDFLSQIKTYQEKRLSVAYCDRKGVLRLRPDLRFRGKDYWGGDPDPVMTFDRDLLKTAEVVHNPFRISQVKLSGTTDKLRPVGANFPANPDVIGEPVNHSGLLVNSVGRLSAWSEAIYRALNSPDELNFGAAGIQRALDIDDVVDVDYEDRAGHRSIS